MSVQGAAKLVLIGVAVVSGMMALILAVEVVAVQQHTTTIERAQALAERITARRYFLLEYVTFETERPARQWEAITRELVRELEGWESERRRPDLAQTQLALEESLVQFRALQRLQARQPESEDETRAIERGREILVSQMLITEQRAAQELFQLARDEVASMVALERQQVLLTALLFALAAAYLIGIVIATGRFVVRPLARIVDATTRFSRKEFSVRAPLTGAQELRELARTFNVMAAQVTDYYRDLRGIIEEKERLRQESELMVEQKDAFISAASHELRTPLTAMRMWADLLYDMDVEAVTSTYRTAAQRMQRELETLDLLVADLLRAVKPVSTTILSPVQIGCHQLVQESVASIQTELTQHTVRIINESSCTVLADPVRFKQALGNIVRNAAKYSPDAAEIVVRIHVADVEVIIAVEDKGIGIAPEHRERIFDRFFRVYTEQSQSFPGLGVGLWIARDIIEAHHGRVWVESEEGEGSVFYIALLCHDRRGPEQLALKGT